MGKFLHFLQYHNAVPIAVTILVTGAGATFAATNPQAIYSATQTPLSVDNTYIAGKDLGAFSPKVTITAVTEDDDYYYLTYKLSTIDLKDYVWQDMVREDSMKVSKADLGKYRDLGVYVTGQFKDILSSENARLDAAQDLAKKSLSQKVVATEYGGLVGKFLDEKTEVLPGYTPVVEAPPEVAFVGNSMTSGEGSTNSGTSGSSSSEASADGGSSTTSGESSSPAPQSGGNGSTIQILGNNPAQIEIGTRYADLGAAITDGSSDGLNIATYLNGRQVDAVSIDTSAPATYTVRYVATTKKGTSWAERIIIVYDPAQGPPVAHVQSAPPVPEPETTTDTSSDTTTATSTTDTSSTTATSTETSTSTPDTSSDQTTSTSTATTTSSTTDNSSQTASAADAFGGTTTTDTTSTATDSTATSTTP